MTFVEEKLQRLEVTETQESKTEDLKVSANFARLKAPKDRKQLRDYLRDTQDETVLDVEEQFVDEIRHPHSNDDVSLPESSGGEEELVEVSLTVFIIFLEVRRKYERNRVIGVVGKVN